MHKPGGTMMLLLPKVSSRVILSGENEESYSR